jgi:hypothetical protein
MLMEELKELHGNHERAVRDCERKLELGAAAGKVMHAVRDRKTEIVTGNDMAGLVMAINNDAVFLNRQSVKFAIEARHELVRGLCKKLLLSVEEYKQQLNSLEKV